MNVIQPNCRIQFTAEDIAFIIAALGRKAGDAESLVKLLTDEEARDLILDDERLLHALLEARGCLRVSAHFYFYVLVRQVFRRASLDDRRVADYVAELLAEYSALERTRCPVRGPEGELNYFFELLAALQGADDFTTFQLRAHIANHSLFLAGVFPDRIRARAEQRGFPGMRYYEELGRTNFQLASGHRLARRHDLSRIFALLAERFQTTRLALNDMGDRLLSLGEADCSRLLWNPAAGPA